MSIFGIGRASTPAPEPSERTKQLTAEEIKDAAARAKEQTTNKEEREILQGVLQVLHESGDSSSTGAKRLQERLDNIPADTVEDKLPKGNRF